MTRRRLAALALALMAPLLCAAPMRADFNGVVRAVSRTRGLHRVDVPMIGLARFVVWIMHPKGVHDFQLATFEGNADLNGSEMKAILNAEADGFTQVVHARSRRTGEFSLIYAKPAKDAIEMIVISHDKSETAVVRAVVDIDTFAREVNGGEGVVKMARGR